MREFLGKEMDNYVIPSYPPWEQRVCTTLDGEFLVLVREKRIRIVTDTVRQFTDTGILCNDSGEELKADLVISATGFNLQNNYPMNHIAVTVDGVPYNSGDTMM